MIGPHKEDEFLIQSHASAGHDVWPRRTPNRSCPRSGSNHGDTVTVGGETFEVRHCPGHTPGHVVFYNATHKFVIVGDVLFHGSIGRTDLPRGDHATLLRSIREQLLTCPTRRASCRDTVRPRRSASSAAAIRSCRTFERLQCSVSRGPGASSPSRRSLSISVVRLRPSARAARVLLPPCPLERTPQNLALLVDEGARTATTDRQRGQLLQRHARTTAGRERALHEAFELGWLPGKSYSASAGSASGAMPGTSRPEHARSAIHGQQHQGLEVLAALAQGRNLSEVCSSQRESSGTSALLASKAGKGWRALKMSRAVNGYAA